MHKALEDFLILQGQLNASEQTIALLVLAEAIRDSATFNRSNAENFGHELSLALKNVLQNSDFFIREGSHKR